MEYINSLKWRYAVKKYDAAKKVPAEDIEVIKDAIQLSVSSVGLQPYKVFIVETQSVKEELAEAAGGNNKNIFKDASHLFIFANELNVNSENVDIYIDNISEQREVTKDSVSGFADYINSYLAGLNNEEKNIWTAKQTYIALANLISAAAILKVDATPMEGFDAPSINKILGLDKKGLNTAVIASLGYRHEEDAQQHVKKVRKPDEQLFTTL